MLRVALLGPPVIEADGAPARFDTRKAIALLAVLAVSRAPQSRERLAALFWPESDDERARSSLRRTLSVTTAATGPAVVVSRSTVSLDAAQVWCDLWEFERLAALGDAASLAEAAALYRDDFLTGFRTSAGPELDDWLQLVGEEQRQRLGRVLTALVEARTAAGQLEEGLADARRWLALDPMHEPAHQAMMRLLSWTGQRGAALNQYRRCVRILDRELSVAPLPETSALYEEILADRLERPVARSVVAPSEPEAARRTPLLGQQRQLGELLGAFDRVGPRGRLVTVVGPGGSGKTRLIEELRDELASRGASVAVAHCHDGEREIAFGAVTDLLRAAVRSCLDLPERLGAGDRAEVARLVPELAAGHEPASAPPLESPGAQIRFFDALGVALVAALGGSPGGAAHASPGGTLGGAASAALAPAASDAPGATPRRGVAVVEDVQFLDDASAQLLGYLVRRLDAAPLLVVLTWQQGLGPPPPLRSAIAGSERAGHCSTVAPHPFGRAEIALLLEREGLRDVQPDVLLAQTGGLPLLAVSYVENLAAAARRGEHGERGEPGEPGLPATARQLLEGRLAAASAATSQVLAAAAVLGGRCDAELLRLTSGRGALEVADALDEAVRLALLVEEAAPPDVALEASYDFPYEALRRVVYESCGPARRRLLHSRAADVLARRSERSGATVPGVVSKQLQQAGRNVEAASWSWQAAHRSLALYAHAEALTHLRSALELGGPDAEAHTAIADSLIALGRYREALVELEQAAAALDADDAVLASVEHRLAGVHDRLGNFELAEAHLEAARELAGEDVVLAARIEADHALVAYRSGRPDAATIAAAALEAASASGDARALAQARNVAGVLAGLAGDRTSAERLLRASLEAAQSLADPGPAVAALNNLARMLAEAGRDAEALSIAEEALALGERHGDVHRVAALHSNLADLLHASGRTDESIAHLKLSAAGFASVDAGEGVRPEVWTLVEW